MARKTSRAWDYVDTIVVDYNSGMTMLDITKKYNVPYSSLQAVLSKCEDDGLVQLRKRGPASKLTEEQMQEIVKMRETTDLSFREIAQHFGVSGNRVEQVCIGRGVKPKQGRFMKTTDFNTICVLHKRGLNMRQISREVGYCQYTVKGVLCEAGLISGPEKR